MPVTAKRGSITELEDIDVIVSAANGVGITGNVGVAGAIRRAAGGEPYGKHVRAVAMEKTGGFDEGQVYISKAGDLEEYNGIQAVFHAVTMKYPGGPTTYEIVDKCLEKVLTMVSENGYTSVAIPGLGTGVGHLDPQIVARRTVRIAQKYTAKFPLDVLVIDIDPEFVAAAEKALSA